MVLYGGTISMKKMKERSIVAKETNEGVLLPLDKTSLLNKRNQILTTNILPLCIFVVHHTSRCSKHYATEVQNTNQQSKQTNNTESFWHRSH